jgi:hypothetical protein
MKKYVTPLLISFALLHPLFAHSTQYSPFSFGVIAKPLKATAGESMVREAIAESDADNLAFVIANGVKAGDESCSDEVYTNRRSLFNEAKNGLIVSVTASDWAQCVNAKNRSISTERLSRLRDVFFADEFSFGDSKIPLVHQSTMPKFRLYAENMHWRIGDVMFATVNLPSNNNNYLNAAGRNSEFEDRQIANNDWLKRIFLTAKISKLDGVVIFCDGNPLIHAETSSFFSSASKREGFADIRKQITAFAGKFQGKILIVHSDLDARRMSKLNGIEWKANIGTLHTEVPWVKITVDPGQSQLFVMKNPAVTTQAARR